MRIKMISGVPSDRNSRKGQIYFILGDKKLLYVQKIANQALIKYDNSPPYDLIL